MASGKLCEKSEIRCGLKAQRWNRHEPRQRQNRRAHSFDERSKIGNCTATFLLLLADIDLDIDGWRSPGFLPLLHKRVEQRAAIERVNGVEQFDRICRLVRLE